LYKYSTSRSVQMHTLVGRKEIQLHRQFYSKIILIEDVAVSYKFIMLIVLHSFRDIVSSITTSIMSKLFIRIAVCSRIITFPSTVTVVTVTVLSIRCWLPYHRLFGPLFEFLRNCCYNLDLLPHENAEP